ncbi:MAG: carboxypeptidase regulatory-like domain-containing protein, partial [Calditrichaeota bacterium]|nr:carboxypeptidase regulatory-like domain-containing protein [Calditrichota bacterium]
MARKMYARVLLLTVALLLAGAALAQQVVVRPHQVTLQPGQGQQFEAQLFDRAGRPVRGVTCTWSVEPSFLGTVTRDGYFIAGPEPGPGRVTASVVLAGVQYRGSADVVVAEARLSGKQLLVEPAEVVLAPGQSQQFTARLMTSRGVTIVPTELRWEVVPTSLGTIASDGLFTAGTVAIAGQVIAQATVDGRLLRGAARVLVSQGANGLITGLVVDARDGSALAGALVTVQCLGPLPWARHDTTDADGSYAVPVLAPGMYVVHACAPGFLPEYYDDAPSLREATPISIAAGDTIRGIDFALAPGGAIGGMVAAEADSLPLPGAHVQAYSPAFPNVRYHAVTDKGGLYIIGSLPRGSYVVEASAAGYKGEFYADAASLRSATLVEVAGSDTTLGIDFFLATSSAITGCVVDEVTGAPIPLAQVCAHAVDGVGRDRDRVATARTDSSGCYALPVRPGTYQVMARADGYADEWYDGVSDRRLATPVVVVADQHTSGIDFRLSAVSAIAGRVTDETGGVPIVGALVTAYQEGPGARCSSARTSEDGSYFIGNLQPGNYLVRAAAPDYLAEWYKEAECVRDATPVAVAAADTVQGVDFTLKRGGSITGSVRSQRTGQPIAGARVEVFSTAGPFSRVAFADSEGTYAVVGLPSGSYLVCASARDHVPVYYDGVLTRIQATPVTVNAPEETSGIDFLLPSRLLDGATIAGRVTDERTGEPLRGVRVFATPVRPGQVYTDLTDGEGSYVLTGLRPGVYIVWAFKTGYLAEFYQDAHSWLEATRITVAAGDSIRGIDFALRPQERGPFMVTGAIASKEGQPVAGAMVLARRGEELVATAVSDENGQYALDELPEGSYTVCAIFPI